MAGAVEHVLAYALVGLVFGLGVVRANGKVLTGILISVMAAFLEGLQYFSPGRHPEVAGFVSSSAGLWLGLGIATVMTRLTSPRPTD
jgi:VanZ family protein